ncbi:MAG TPA: patatin-like phospholipase family protein [Candidatus Sulfotelmatobacter sp.]|nr:patatin-like phospholipase family protein [Candidatus Sulfotelmatobacter sp.]
MPDNATTTDRPRRLLAIDGGGLLGLIPAECLILIEQQLNQITGVDLPLCDRFDLIGGTSTGAILAAGLALGLKAADLRDFYLKFGQEIFTKEFLPVRFWHKYPSAPLEKHLKDVLGESTTLGGKELRTQILIVTKNATHGDDWFFTNNPNTRHYKYDVQLPLWQLVRASTAAPTYFPPQAIEISGDDGKTETCEFIDGGVSSYNNPALQVFLEATIPDYGNGWPMGSDKLMLISLGTGFNSTAIAPGKASHYELLDWAQYMIKEMMNEANLQQNILMHVIGCRPEGIASATNELTTSGAASGIPDLDTLNQVSRSLGPQKLVTYQRFTVGLTRKRLDQLGLPDVDPIKVREMDAADQIENMQRVGAAVAKEQVKMEAFCKFFQNG